MDDLSTYDRLALRVTYLLENKIPFKEWTNQELAFYAYEHSGFGCPSCNSKRTQE